MTAATGVFPNSDQTNSAAAKATVAFIFIFGAVYSFGLTPLQALYPVEVLSFEMRAKGMAFSSLAVNAGGLLGQFAWPVSLKMIGWHTYIIFVAWDAVQFVVFYFFLPETKNRTVCHEYLVFHRCEWKLMLVFCNSSRSSTTYLLPKIPSRPKKIALGADRSVVGVEEA
jgi:hypothetical protein